MSDEGFGARRGAPDHFFADPVTDKMLGVLFNLANETWAQEERLRLLEGRAVDPGHGEAKAFVERVFAPLRDLAPE